SFASAGGNQPRARTISGRLLSQDALPDSNSTSHRSGSSVPLSRQLFHWFGGISAGERYLAFASHGTFYRSYSGSNCSAVHSASEQGRAIRIRVAGRRPPAVSAASLSWF